MGKHLLTSVDSYESKSSFRTWVHSSFEDGRRSSVSLQRDFAMRKLALLWLLAGVALPAVAARNITVEQLEQVLAAVHGKADAKVAQQLSGLELTERLSAARLSRWEADLPGPESRQSLVLLADVAAFLDPPAAEIPATPAP